ncbi:uncharacterized protein BDV14DRAFT_183340 [Aspergillus stella-maris]|uniref:uncharacterized protein n=1 Tax=Aspergillus stella-maris TaxID=1810926 RepID=UPI003CCE3E7F
MPHNHLGQTTSLRRVVKVVFIGCWLTPVLQASVDVFPNRECAFRCRPRFNPRKKRPDAIGATLNSQSGRFS